MSDLTLAQRTALQHWLDEAAPRVGLASFVLRAGPGYVAADEGGDDGTAFAASDIRDFADEATISIGTAFWELDRTERRVTLAHELLHVLMYPLHLHRKRIEDALGPQAEALARATARSIEEHLIDHLARVIAPTLPPVDIPEP